jgi:F-type H+-transporting ATPase subunit epsilon
VTEGRLQYDLITPAESLAQGDAAFLTAMGAEGEIGILPSHAALVSRLGIGEVRVHRDRMGGHDRTCYAINRGFLQVENDKVILLVPQAVAGANVDEDAVQRELKEAVEALAHPKDDAAYEELLAQRQWCEARLRAARRTREWGGQADHAARTLRSDVG